MDSSGNGEVDESELRDAFEHHEEGKGDGPAAGGSGPAAALAKLKKGPPSAGKIIKNCDEDESGGLTLEEAHACIDKMVPEEYRADAHAEVDAGFDDADTDGSGEVTKKELRAAMKARGHGPPPKAD